MSNTLCGSCSQPIPVPVVPAIPPCLSSDPCASGVYTSSKCVIYDDEELPSIGVVNGDRLNTIIKKFALNQGSQAIAVEDTDSMEIVGNGLTSNRLKVNARINPVIGNLLESTPDGLKVVFNKANVLILLELIESDNDLKNAFCMLVQGCGDYSCTIASNLNTSMS